jgi:hypothetical protein
MHAMLRAFFETLLNPENTLRSLSVNASADVLNP